MIMNEDDWHNDRWRRNDMEYGLWMIDNGCFIIEYMDSEIHYIKRHSLDYKRVSDMISGNFKPPISLNPHALPAGCLASDKSNVLLINALLNRGYVPFVDNDGLYIDDLDGDMVYAKMRVCYNG